MKKLFRTMLASLLLFAAASCESNDEPSLPYIEPTYVNMAGTWRLSAWNGVELGDSPYMYIVFNRAEHTFDMYQNLDSGKSRHITGTYELITNEDGITTVKGIYDHAAGFWSHDYFVRNMTDSQMTWVVTDNDNDVSVYTRCSDIPEDILNGTRAL